MRTAHRHCKTDGSRGAQRRITLECTIPGWLERCIMSPPFPSRKNLVFRARWDGRSVVAKVFAHEFRDRAGTEHEVLGLCRDARISAPRPLLLRDGVVIMTSLGGRNVFDVLQGEDRSGRASSPAGGSARRMPPGRAAGARVLDGTARWLARFHGAFRGGRRRGDCIPKNFMTSAAGVSGFDFEESSGGDPLADIGQFCAHLLASGEAFQATRFDAASLFASRYWKYSGHDRSRELPGAVAEGLEHFARFRKDGGLLRTWARRISGP